MNRTLTYKILKEHLQVGNLEAGQEIRIKVDQTLTQDSTGTMVYLQLEALDPREIKTDLSVAYIDHNMLQAGFENADDHAFIRSVAEKRGLVFSKPGGGICHQVHLERFAKPGATLIGSDSHTPTAGGIGSLAIGAGGLDVAVAMAKGYYHITVPKVYGIHLTGKLREGVNGKDVILTILQKLTVKGGVGYIMEYLGEGVTSLSVTDRATICNMGAELGATTSIFPSDFKTQAFLRAQNRADEYHPYQADNGAVYHENLWLDLSEIEPMVAMPHSPDNVTRVSEIAGLKVDQVAIGSCTNSSYSDMMKVAQILDGEKVAPHVDLVISPGSSNILRLLAENGALAKMISAGARILESACGPCIGMGQSPKTDAISLRSFNRNFKGRSGTMSAGVFLVSPETAAASAIKGVVTNPWDLGKGLKNEELEDYGAVDEYFIYPKGPNPDLEVIMGPNIKPFPLGKPLEDLVEARVLLKVGDNVTTDDIVPSHAKLLPFRSNVPYLAKFCFTTMIEDFLTRSMDHEGGFVIGGDNYGQGSSREHAALVPLHLGVRAVLAKSFARIHRSNLINAGILPLVFQDPADYDTIEEFHRLRLPDVRQAVLHGQAIRVENLSTGASYLMDLKLSTRERDSILAGGYLLFVKNQAEVTL